MIAEESDVAGDIEEEKKQNTQPLQVEEPVALFRRFSEAQKSSKCSQPQEMGVTGDTEEECQEKIYNKTEFYMQKMAEKPVFKRRRLMQELSTGCHSFISITYPNVC